MENFRYFIHLAYSGKDFKGWQKQPDTPTVQQALDEALSILLRNQTGVVGAGRTDTGVHARKFYAHFDYPVCLNQHELNNICYRLNRILPVSISIYEIFAVKPEIHSRFSALSRTYRYYFSRMKDPFLTDFAWHYEGKLDVAAMKQIAGLLPQYSDFACFSKKGSDTGTTICHVTESYFLETSGMLIYHVKANRFLRNMVRAITGTLLEVGKGKLDEEGFHKLLTGGARSDAGESVPAHGLFLEDIEYPDDFRLFTE